MASQKVVFHPRARREHRECLVLLIGYLCELRDLHGKFIFLRDRQSLLGLL